MHGTTNEGFTIDHMNEIKTKEYVVAHMADIGTPDSYDQLLRRRLGARVGHAPTSGPSRSPSHWGGTRNGTIVSWPNGDRRHAARSATSSPTPSTSRPTVLEAAGIPEPATVHGVTQRPYEGTAMNYSFDDADAAGAARRPSTSRCSGTARSTTRAGPRSRSTRTPGWRPDHGLDDDVWELYNIEEDWTQSHDLAAEEPERLAHLQRLFLIQAARFNVLPHGHPLARQDEPRPSPDGRELVTGTTQTFYPGMRRLSENTTINIKNRSLHGDRERS